MADISVSALAKKSHISRSPLETYYSLFTEH